jgi:hypothetical protein
LVNYGYGPGMIGWDESKKWILAGKLRDLLVRQGLTKDNIEIESGVMLHENPREPYIEVDSLYEGVRIRKITYLTEEQSDRLIIAADRIYKELMGIE